MSDPNREFYAGDLFGEIQYAQAEAQEARRPLAALVPGLILAGIASLAAAFLSDAYGFPLILLGLLIGLALSFLAEEPVTAPGLDFVARHALRWGIVLLGLQVTFAEVAALGWGTGLGLLAVMGSAMAAGVVAARLARQQAEAGLLAGGATAICGASAALALYGVIGRDRLDQARFTVTLMGVALASALVMAATPLIAHALDFTDTQAGFLIGAAVHDAGQAIGGGYSYSAEAGNSATIVKLARVALLAPVTALVALWLARGAKGADAAGVPIWKRLALPWFILAFLALVALGSVVAIPQDWADGGLTVSKALLLVAVTATAIRAQLRLLLGAGWRALMPIVGATLASLVAAIVVAALVVG